MSSIFERFCYNDVEGPCDDSFKCSPCHLTLPDPNCRRIQYFSPVRLNLTNIKELRKDLLQPHIKTEIEMKRCKEKRDMCEMRFKKCLKPFSKCIQNCTEYLKKETLDKYSTYKGILSLRHNLYEKRHFV